MSNKRGKIIVIVAPSGTGKSTLIKKLKRVIPQLEESVSYTTRTIRANEKDGVNYFYISKEKFIELRDNNEFLEYAIVHSNFYGTRRSFVEERLQAGAFLLFDLDVQGADFFKKEFGDEAKIIFLEPPSVDELESRLVNRGTEPAEVIKERVANAKEELKRKNDYDFLVLNNDLEVAYKKLEEIFLKIIKG